MAEIVLGGVRVRFCFGFFAAVLFFFYARGGDSYAVGTALVCCFLHELGHLAAMCLFSQPPEMLCFYAGGMKLIPRSGELNGRLPEAVILSAGCAVNFITAFISALLGLELARDISLALGIFNLLPFSGFDGGRLAELFLTERIRKTAAVALILSAAVCILFSGIAPIVLLIPIFAALSELLLKDRSV